MIERTNHYESITLHEGLPILYKCVSRTPGFKDPKVWSAAASTNRLTDHVIARVRRVRPKGFKWTFCRNENGIPRLVFHKVLRCNNWQYLIPLDWLPMLKKQNEQLHDLVVDVFRMIVTNWRLSVVTNRFNCDILSGNESGGHLAEVELIKHDRHSYARNGEAKKYQRLLMQRPGHSLESLKKKVEQRSWGKTHATQSVSYWLDGAIKAIEGAQNIKDFYSFGVLREKVIGSSHAEGFPLRPQDYFGFVWSFNDTIYSEMLGNMRSCKDGIGYADPVAQIEYYPDRKGTRSTEALEKLGRFIDNGLKVYHRYYHRRIQYHRVKVNNAFHPMKNKMNQERSPYLIDILR